MFKRQLPIGISILSLTSIGVLLSTNENIGLITLVKRIPRFWLVFLLILLVILSLLIGYAWWRLPQIVGKIALISLMVLFIATIIGALLQTDQRRTLSLIVSASIGLITTATSLVGLHQQASFELNK